MKEEARETGRPFYLAPPFPSGVRAIDLSRTSAGQSYKFAVKTWVSWSKAGPMSSALPALVMLALHQAGIRAQSPSAVPSQTRDIAPSRVRAVRPPLITQRQESSTRTSVCGYQDGDQALRRTAEPGYQCCKDDSLGLWGFCISTMALTDVSFAGACWDSAECSNGYGATAVSASQLTTITW